MGNLPLSSGQLQETGANTGCGAPSHGGVIKDGAPSGPVAWRGARVPSACWWGNGLPRLTVSRPERVIGHTGTETLPRLLREAAVEDHSQCAKA